MINDGTTTTKKTIMSRTKITGASNATVRKYRSSPET